MSVIQVNFPMLQMAAQGLKNSSADFVTHIGAADQACKPLKQSWGDSDSLAADAYQQTWVKIVDGAFELSRTIERLSKAVSNAQQTQLAQEKSLANQFPA